MKAFVSVIACVSIVVSQAYAAAESFTWHEPVIEKAASCAVGHSYGLEGRIAKGVSVVVSITMKAVLKDGQHVALQGRPYVLFGDDRTALDRNRSKFLQPSQKGVYIAPKNGVFRVLVDGNHAVNEVKGVVDFEDYRIEVCPVG